MIIFALVFWKGWSLASIFARYLFWTMLGVLNSLSKLVHSGKPLLSSLPLLVESWRFCTFCRDCSTFWDSVSLRNLCSCQPQVCFKTSPSEADRMPSESGIIMKKKNKQKQNGNMTWSLQWPSHTLVNVIFTIGFFIFSLDFWAKCILLKVSLFFYGKILMPNPMAKCLLDSTLILNAWLQIFQYNLLENYLLILHTGANHGSQATTPWEVKWLKLVRWLSHKGRLARG